MALYTMQYVSEPTVRKWLASPFQGRRSRDMLDAMCHSIQRQRKGQQQY